MKRILCLAALIGLGSVASAGGQYAEEQLKAGFYFDLGADTIDVSSYPRVQQNNYKVFSQVCFQCHTLARAINAPILSRQDWERYVRRMAIDTKDRAGTHIDPADAKRIIDFLAYDSRRRKVEAGERFKADTRKMKIMFAEVLKERLRLQVEENAHEARGTTLGAEAQPSAKPQARQ